jgi:hypothetical protein
MARGTKNKSKGISLEELMQAQERMMGTGNLSEKQLQLAKDQLEKLDTIAKASVVNDVELAKENLDIRKITARKSVAGSVGLVDVKNEINNLSKTLKQGLPKLLQEKGQSGKKNAEEKSLTEAERNQRLTKLAEIIGEKVKLQKGGSLNETLTAKNRGTFDQFIKETERRDTLLAEANEDQREIFKQIEDTLIKLQEAGSEDSRDLRKELERLHGAMQETEDTGAKKSLTDLAGRTSENAAAGVGGNQGTFGDALKALLGRREVLKSGMSRTAAGDIVNDKGDKVDAKEAVMGRAAGAGSILKNMMMEKFERGFEDKRGGRVGAIFDAFKGSGDQSRVNVLEGRQQSLTKNLVTGMESPIKETKSSTKSMAAGAAKSMAANTLNISGKIINLKGPVRIEGAASSATSANPNAMFSDAGAYRADDAAGPFAKGSDKIVKAIKELTEVIQNQQNNGLPGIPPSTSGTAAGKTPKGGARPNAGNAAKAAKNVKPGSPVVMGLSLIAGYFGMSMIDDAEENARAERTAKYDAMIASGDPEQVAKGQFMKEQEMSTFEKLGNIKNQFSELNKPERQERLKDAPWYTRYLGIGDDAAVAPSLRPAQGPEIAARTNAIADQRSAAAAPIIINAPTVNAPVSKGGENTVTTVMRAPVRSEDNAFNNYMNRIYHPF